VTKPHLDLRHLTIFGLAVLNGGCADTSPWQAPVDPAQIGGAWVFTFSLPQGGSMHALLTGQAAVVDGCLQVDDFVVVWRQSHLSTVEEIIGRIDDGETVTVSLGGGGGTLDEGSSVEDFPKSVTDRCSLSGIWHSADGEITIEEEG
jgi:hypothetical protein